MHRSFDWSFYLTVVYFLLIYTRLTICADNLLLLHPLIASLSTETAAFLLFCFFVPSVCVSGCIQTFTFASRSCCFHCHQPLRHSLSPVTAFAHFCFSHRRLAISCLLRLPVAVVGFLIVLLFRRRPLIHSLQIVVTIVGLPLVYFSFS